MASTMAEYKEFPLLYMIYKEANSFLSGHNAQKLGGMQSMSSFGSPDKMLWGGNYSVWHPQQVNLGDSGQFSNASMFREYSLFFSGQQINADVASLLRLHERLHFRKQPALYHVPRR